MIAVRINRVLIIARLHADRIILAALIFPLRASLSTSKVSRSPTRRLSGSMALQRGDVHKYIRTPESSLMKPKPRSAFHIFKVPVAIDALFPLRLQPTVRSPQFRALQGSYLHTEFEQRRSRPAQSLRYRAGLCPTEIPTVVEMDEAMLAFVR